MSDNAYSQVLFRPRDAQTADIVNSFRFQSSSPSRVRRWSPEVAAEDRFRRKRAREDALLHALPAERRPLLVVQRKQVFERLAADEDAAATEHYFKISDEARPVEDLEREVAAQQRLAKRQTVVGAPAGGAAPESPAVIYKIQGVEFLPEGFLELDPLLYKDEYLFSNKASEKLFEAEQRRLKALRRRQYERRHGPKSREVTIFVLDELRDKLLDYFEKWYFQNRRRMDAEELAHAARLFDAPPESIEKLQEVYLKRSKLVNEARIRQASRRFRGKKISQLPASLRKYFEGVGPLEQRDRPAKQSRPEPAGKEASKSLGRSVSFGSLAQPAKDDPPLNYSMSESLGEQPLPRETAELKKAYDSQIDQILGDIHQRSSAKKSKAGDSAVKAAASSELPKPNPTLLQSEVDEDRARAAGGDDEPARVSTVARAKDGSVCIRQSLRPSLVGGQYFFQVVEELVDRMGSKAVRMVTRNDEGAVVAEQSLDPRLSGLYDNKTSESEAGGQRKVTVSVTNERGKTVALQNHRPTVMTLIGDTYFDDCEEIADPRGRKTTVSRKNTADARLSATKLRPTLLGAEYYCQLVSEAVSDGRLSARLLTKDPAGRTVSEVALRPDHLAASYISEVVQEAIEDGQRSFVVETKNDRGTVVARQTIQPKLSAQIGDAQFDCVDEEVVSKSGARKLTVMDAADGQKLSCVGQNTKTGEADDAEAPPDRLPSMVTPKATAIINQYYVSLMKELDLEREDAVASKPFGRFSQKNAPKKVEVSKSKTVGSSTNAGDFSPSKQQFTGVETTGLSSTENQESEEPRKKSALRSPSSNSNSINRASKGRVRFEEDAVEQPKKSTVVESERKSQTPEYVSRVSIKKSVPAEPERKVSSNSAVEPGRKTTQRTNEQELEAKKSMRPPAKQSEVRAGSQSSISKSKPSQADLRSSQIDSSTKKSTSNLKEEKMSTSHSQKKFSEPNAKPSKTSQAVQGKLSTQQAKTSKSPSLNRSASSKNQTKPSFPKNIQFEGSDEEPDDYVPPSKPSAKLTNASSKISTSSSKAAGETPKLTKSPSKSPSFGNKHSQPGGSSVFEPEEDISTVFIDNGFAQQRKKTSWVDNPSKQTKTTKSKHSISNIYDKKYSEKTNPLSEKVLLKMSSTTKQSKPEQLYQKQSSNQPKESSKLFGEAPKPSGKNGGEAYKAGSKASGENALTASGPLSDQELLKESLLLKDRLDDYIHKLNESKRFDRPSQEEELRQKIREVYLQEKEKLEREAASHNSRTLGDSSVNSKLFEEFYDFCRDRLASDSGYKESILFVSLFYYFMEKKKQGLTPF